MKSWDDSLYHENSFQSFKAQKLGKGLSKFRRSIAWFRMARKMNFKNCNWQRTKIFYWEVENGFLQDSKK